MSVVDNSLRDVVMMTGRQDSHFPAAYLENRESGEGGVMNTDEPREMDMQVATISVRRWTRAWRHHLCRLAVAGLVAGLVLVGLVSTVQAGPHFVLEKVTVTKGGQTYTLAKNASGQWVIPVWPDVPATNPLAYFSTWRLEVNGGSNYALRQLYLHSDVKLGGKSKGKANSVPVNKAGKNILFNYNNWNFPVGIQLVVNINPPVTSAVDRLVKGGPPPTH